MRCYIYVATLTQWSLPLSITFPSNHSCPSILILLSKGDRFHFLGFTICPPNWQVTLGMSEVSSIFSIFQPANRSIIGRQRSHRIARVGSMLNTIELFPTKLNLIRSSKQLSLSQFLIDASYWCKPRHSPSFAILSRIFSRQRSCPIWLLQEVNSSIPGEGVCKMMATRGLELHFPGASTSTLHFFDVFGHLALNVTYKHLETTTMLKVDTFSRNIWKASSLSATSLSFTNLVHRSTEPFFQRSQFHQSSSPPPGTLPLSAGVAWPVDEIFPGLNHGLQDLRVVGVTTVSVQKDWTLLHYFLRG